MLYEWPATMAAGVMVKAIGVVWARAATTMDAPTKRVFVKCMLITVWWWLVTKVTVDEVIKVKSALPQMECV